MKTLSMKLDYFKDITRTGDVIVTRNPFKWYDPLSWLSTAIRFFARTYYNHAKLVVYNWGIPFVNEAIGRGVVTHQMGTRMRGKEIMLLRPVAETREKSIAYRANAKLGVTKYDFLGLIYQAIFLTTGKWIGPRGEKADKRQYCFEYIGWVYINLFPKHYRITPGEIINSEHLEVVAKVRIK